MTAARKEGSSFIDDLDRFLLASIQKSAEEPSTTHPSDSVEDGNQPADTGERAAENEADVKATIPGENVNEAKEEETEGEGRGQNAPVLEIGTEAAPTGEAPAVETESAKDSPSDPGTTHPATAEMGDKYSKLIGDGDSILADITLAVSAMEKGSQEDAPAEAKKEEVPAVAAPAETEAKVEEKKDEDKKPSDAEAEAEAAGKEVAAALADAMQASAVRPDDIIANIIKQAEDDGQNVADYMDGFAGPAEGVPADASQEGMPQDVMPAPDAMPQDAMPQDAGPQAGGEGGMSEEELMALVEALLQAGVTPEDLLALAGGAGQDSAPAEAQPEAQPELQPETPIAESSSEAPVEEKLSSKRWNQQTDVEKRATLMTALKVVRARGKK